MASPAALPLLLFLLVCPYAAAAGGGASCGYTHMFSFGDSISDNGNLVTVYPSAPATAPPYGETFFRRPTGRFCDGRLIVDFIAEALGLAFAPPFLGVGRTAAEFRQGANFAVGGATALAKDFFREMGLSPALVRFIPPYSLDVQMEWFRQVLHLLGPTEQERKDIVSSSLFVVGEIGENDYIYLILQNRSLDAVIKPLVIPKVVAKIENAIKVLLELGAKTIVVPGDFPMGCLARYLTMFQSTNPDAYDASGCIKPLNDLIQQHNAAVRAMVERFPRTTRRSTSSTPISTAPAWRSSAILSSTGSRRMEFSKRAAETAGLTIPTRSCLAMPRPRSALTRPGASNGTGSTSPRRRITSWPGACWTGRMPRRPYCPHADADTM